jgi:hypothetical protein
MPWQVYSFDEINLVYGMDKLDSRLSQPQPPGYPLFVAEMHVMRLRCPCFGENPSWLRVFPVAPVDPISAKPGTLTPDHEGACGSAPCLVYAGMGDFRLVWEPFGIRFLLTWGVYQGYNPLGISF